MFIVHPLFLTGEPPVSAVTSLPARARAHRLLPQKRKHRKFKHVHDKKALKEIFPA